uniref:Uncharacterized protein n=1 Tax=Encephalitozoon cuniculi TaxID=6035 RepID=M1K8C6_ENCCN|nr:hypothetical protein ECU02_0870 [Encephalitozoon cuniculi]
MVSRVYFLPRAGRLHHPMAFLTGNLIRSMIFSVLDALEDMSVSSSISSSLVNTIIWKWSYWSRMSYRHWSTASGIPARSPPNTKSLRLSRLECIPWMGFCLEAWKKYLQGRCLQMGICRNRDFVMVIEKNELLVVDILTLSVFHRRECGAGSVVACCDEYAFIGDGCVLVALCLLGLREEEVCRMKVPITAVFHLDGFVYCGCEDGTIHVYGMTGGNGCGSDVPGSLEADLSNEMFLDAADGAGFRLMRSMRHPGPVTQICSDGAELFVADMRNKITIYPSKKTYDIKGPKLRYKNYIFASERNMLYCRTRSAFATCLTVEKPISDYVFSMNGGTLFAQCRDTVYVIEFNTKKTLKEMDVPGRFVYDDERNRLVWFDGRRFHSIDDIVENGCRGMEDIVFRGDGLVEKKIRVGEETDENVVERHDNYGTPRKSQKRKYFGVYRENRDEGLDGRRDDEEKRRMIESDEHSEEPGIGCTAGTSRAVLEMEAGSLLCYNSEGYMTCIRSEGCDRIEVNYHDVSRRKIEVPGISGCTMGDFCKENVVVGDGRKIFYIGLSSRWEREVEARAIAVSEKMVVVLSEELHIFGLDGSEIFSCLIPDVHAVCSRSDTIAVFSRELILINLFRSTERFLLPSPVDFACFDESGRIFYRIRGKMYYLYKGLSVRACEVPTQPLTVFKGNVISLGSSRRLFPSPHVEYTRFDVFDPLRPKDDVVREEGSSEKVIDVNKPVEVSKNKRYNPLSK